MALYGPLAVLVALCLANWRFGVYAILLISVIEGYVRNRLGDPQVLLIKDAMLAAVYVRLVADHILRDRRLIPQLFLNVPLAAFAAIVLLETLNPQIAGPGEALVGIRTWLWYVPLFYVGIEMARSGDSSVRYQRVLVTIAIVTGIIAAAQYVAGPEAYANQGEAFRQATFVTTAGDSGAVVYRPNSTFAWSSHFAMFLAIGMLCAVALALKMNGWGRALALCGVAFLAIANVVEGQRTMYVLLPILITTMLVLSGRIAGRIRLLATIPLAVGLLAIATLFLPPQLGVLDRPLALLGVERNTFGIRAQTDLDTTVHAILQAPLGAGTGATAIGSRHVLGNIPLFVEFPTAKVAGDLSLIGLGIYAWLFGSLIVFALRAARSARAAQNLGPAVDAALLVALALLVLFTGYDLAIAAVTFWLLAGLLTSRHIPTGDQMTVVSAEFTVTVRGRRSRIGSV
jgi:hypothetical protein